MKQLLWLHEVFLFRRKLVTAVAYWKISGRSTIKQVGKWEKQVFPKLHTVVYVLAKIYSPCTSSGQLWAFYTVKDSSTHECTSVLSSPL